MSIAKKVGFIASSIILTVIVLVGAVWLTNALQRKQDTKVLRHFVQDQSNLQTLQSRSSEDAQVSCKPAGTKGDTCPAILYKISQDECFALLTKYKTPKKWCTNDVAVSYKGRHILLRFGQAYVRHDGGLYVQVIMNEQNLL
jgi:hypothetical protein